MNEQIINTFILGSLITFLITTTVVCVLCIKTRYNRSDYIDINV